jgi:hypothetical protein
MGLEERRQVKQLQDEVLPKYLEKLQEITKTQIAFDFDWDSFVNDKDALWYVESRILQEVVEGFRLICCDQLGLDAVKVIKSIHVKNLEGATCEPITLKDGIVHLHCDWGYGTLWGASSINEQLSEQL